MRPKVHPIRIPHERDRFGNILADWGGKKEMLHPYGKIASDIWNDIHRIRHKVRRDSHPCQLPPHLVERAILATTDPGDMTGNGMACHERAPRRQGESNGSRGNAQIRTIWHITIIARFPHPNSKRRPFVVSPFPWPDDWEDNFEPVTDPSLTNGEKQQQAIHIALKWQHCLKHDKTLTLSKIADTQGISRARVTQIMNLLNLAPDIQEQILFLAWIESGRDPITERHLRPIAAVADWRKQRQVWRSSRVSDCS